MTEDQNKFERKTPDKSKTDIEKYETRHPEVPTGIIEQTPAAMFQLALSKGADLDKLERFMQLQEQWEVREAKKAYVQAMARFKANPPEILKTAHVSYLKKDGTWTEYDHAALGEICEAIGIGLSQEGLYNRWDMTQPEGNVSVTCIITHEMGHSESYGPIEGPPDTSGGKNTIQGISSSNTYLERISLLGITGLAAKGMDKDGRSKLKVDEVITTDQVTVINDLLKKTGVPESKILFNAKVKSVEDIPAKLYQNILSRLNVNKTKMRQPGDE